ncbi:uncharacterized protein METZ01_LOCUS484824, partial [marine metagenome]
MGISQEKLRFYQREGYVILEGVLTDDDLEPLIQDHIIIVDAMARDLHRQGKISRLYEDEPFEIRLARIAEEYEEVDECPDIGFTRRRATYEFLRNKNLVDVIEPFIGPEISCNPVSHVRPKLPSTDVPFHQDAVFTTQEAKDILQVTVWLPLVQST